MPYPTIRVALREGCGGISRHFVDAGEISKRLSATSPSPGGAHDSEFTRIVRILCLSISELDIQQQSNSGKNRFLEHPALDSSAEFVDLRVDLTKVGIILHDRDHRGPSLICRSRTSPMDWCSRYIATFTGMPQQTRARLSAAKVTPGPRNRIGMPGHSGGDITSRRQVGTSSRDIGSIRPPNGPPGDRIAVLSPSFAAAGAFPRFIRDAAAPAASTPRKRAQRAHTTVMTLPAHRLRSLTRDQGKEMSQHPQFTITTLRPCVYFCDPHSPWQGGSNKNTNGSLRQYFPKSSDMTACSQRPHRGGHRARRTAIENPELGPPAQRLNMLLEFLNQPIDPVLRRSLESAT